jgi:hypothetical protein
MAERAKGIFISYRHEETSGQAGRLGDRLSEHFGENVVFHDRDSIAPGSDWFEAIQRAGSSEVLLAVIGREWSTIKDAAGERRLQDPQDFVRTEIATALKGNVRVIPVLVQEASMPSADELPNDLAPLTRCEAFELHENSWRYDVQDLITFLETVTGSRQSTAGSTTPIGVKPDSRSATQDVFRMELDEFYDHPRVQGFLVNCALYETEIRMQVRPHYGAEPLLFTFDDFPKNTWVTVQDNQGNSLPLAVYVDGAMGVYGKWLYPQLPPA